MSTPPTGTQGIGKSKWGDSHWGSGVIPPPGPPVITPLSPVDSETDVSQSAPIFIRFTDDSFVDQATLSISVGPTVYVLGGSAQNGALLFVTLNDGNGFDVELRLPSPYPIGVQQEVVVYVRDDNSEASELIYRFSVGVGVRLLQVRNPEPRILVAYYNRPVLQNASLRFVPNWIIEPISAGAAELEITEVLSNSNYPSMVTLRYIGGGSTYKLTNTQIFDSAGNPIDPDFNSALFEILFGDEPDPSVRLFDTIYGPIGISQRFRLRRTMDDHVVGRSLALGMDEQFRLRMANLDGSAGLDGRPGKNRT
jgi:hypothetical protein